MSNDVIDVHVHFGAPRDEKSGCYWSKEFENTIAYFAMLLITKSIFKKINIQKVLKNILDTINGSKYVHKSVLLAMDQVYDEDGTVHSEKTHLFVPNHYIVDLAKKHDRILFGASIHPYRSDWSEELEYCLENRAVVCKWIPSSQMINPGHPKCIPFYKKLVEHRLPLLCHAGQEHAIPTSDKAYAEYDNPRYLRNALDQGVTVIVAHCALPYFGILEFDYQDDLKEFFELFKDAERNHWNLYADLSAITSPIRSLYTDMIKDHVPADRLLFGSDHPIPLFGIIYNKSKNFFSWLRFCIKVSRMKNPLDKHYMMIEEMDFGDAVFTNCARLFRNIVYP